jgi:hypothetical protein
LVWDAIGMVALVVAGTTAVCALAVAEAADPARWAAAGTAAGLGLGLLFAALRLWMRFRALVPPLSLVRIALAVAGAVLVGRMIPDGGKLMVLGECVLVEVVLLATLVMSGELNRAEVTQMLSSLRARRQGAS